jgi:hypothetical protein
MRRKGEGVVVVVVMGRGRMGWRGIFIRVRGWLLSRRSMVLLLLLLLR